MLAVRSSLSRKATSVALATPFAPSQLRAIADLACLSTLSLVLTGCNLGAFRAPSDASSALPQISGQVHGGQQPVSGATIQLYAANTTVSQGASTALIASSVLTDASGSFDVTGSYTCPAPGALVYIVATGGNPGLPGTVNNSSIALMTVLGTCGSLTASTFVSINELTTVAAAEALAPFMTDYAHVGAGASNLGGLTTAFNSAVAFVSPTSGQIITPLGNGVVPPTALLNTLADILAGCINTPGGTSGDGTVCGYLYLYTASNSNTISAIVSVIRNPTVNVSQIFSVAPPSAPFQPTLTSAPVSFAGYDLLPLTAASGELYDQLLADSQGHIWVLRPSAGTLAQYDSNLNLLHSYNVGSVSTGGTAVFMTLDPSDNLWVPFGAAMLKIRSDGTILSPPTGYPLVQNGLFNYRLVPGSFTSDSGGNIWAMVGRASDGTICLVEYSGVGAFISPPTGYCGSQIPTSQSGPAQVIADAAGNVYLFFIGNGVPVPIEKFSASGAYVDIPTVQYGGLYGYNAVAFDRKDNQIWASGETHADKLNLDGSVAYSTYPILGAAYQPQFRASVLAVDGGGNYWQPSYIGSVLEITSAGALSGPCTVSSCGIPIIPAASNGMIAVAINPAGDIFALQSTPIALLKITGLATAQ